MVATKIAQLVQKRNAQKMLVYISFDFDVLKKIIALNPEAIIQYLEANKSPEELKTEGISGADYYYQDFKNHPE